MFSGGFPSEGKNVRTDASAIADEYFDARFRQRALFMDRIMIWLLAAEWVGMIVTALVVSPRTWSADESRINPHLWAAILAGPAFILPAIGIALLYPARSLTRHTIAVAQLLVSSVLIDCTGGRIETHFHIFGSLAILACYNDWRILLAASSVTAIDHFVRGIWWPQSIYGVLTVSPWRWLEHIWWVLFEDSFLILAAKDCIRNMRLVASSEALLYNGASHDVLTGLPNRRLLQERFDTWMATRQDNQVASLLFIDLDRFKQANDTLGHTVGDRLLTLVAGRLEDAVGRTATLARIGGDEFVALLENTSGMEDAVAAGEIIALSLRPPFFVDGHEVHLSASMGASLCPDHGITLAALQECADRAMYVAKAQGRNRCVAFSSEVSRREAIVGEMERSISSALVQEEFLLYYQPFVQKNGQLAGFEALLRWNHPGVGTVNPSEFIPLLERSGLIISVGAWALTEACRNCVAWQESDPGVRVAVNVSVLQFDQKDYPDQVFAALAETGLDPSLLTLELTEGILLGDLARAHDHLSQIRLVGVKVALDDFGTGYSSISYLSGLPVDSIKLDHNFVKRELTADSPILAAIVNLAHSVGLKVVAEGVESYAEMEKLLTIRCDQFQGYYFSEPMPTEEVGAMLEQSSRERLEIRKLV